MLYASLKKQQKTLCDGVTTEIINIYLKLKSIEISLAQNLFQTNI